MSQAKTKKEKKHNWMASFVVGKPTSEIDKVRYESMARMRELKHKLIKNK